MFKLFGGGKKTETEPVTPPVETEIPQEEAAVSGFGRLKAALSQTGKSLIGSIVSLGKDEEDDEPLSEDALDNIEETLIRADVGVDMAVKLTETIRRNKNIQTHSKLKAFLKEEFTKVLTLPQESNRLRLTPGKLNLILVVGVNGAGKTTLIGKLAHRWIGEGKKVVIAAGDTFRAAAEDQLEIWAQRAGAELVRKDNADAAAVIFDAIHQAVENQADVLLIDTAGRLQNKFNLMEELKKIKKIIEREAPADMVYESLLVIDATTGQNAMRQAEVFQEAVQLTGVALTKLDGSAKGGIVFNIASTYHLPVKLVGVGEKIEDLRDFEPSAFIEALFES
jgi:fused signal recognition particle receptor